MRTPEAPSAWRRWRTGRPFWGGLFVIVAGIEIILAVRAPLPVVLHVGMQGLAGYMVPVVLLLCGILLLTNPSQRLFYSTIAAVLTLASWVTSNLGGFIVGLLLGLVGSALAFAWTPALTRKNSVKATKAETAETAETGRVPAAITDMNGLLDAERGAETEFQAKHESHDKADSRSGVGSARGSHARVEEPAE